MGTSYFLISSQAPGSESVNSLAREAEQPLHARDPVVLVVDDDPQVLDAVRCCFRDDPFEVITAGSCDEAFAWASEVPVSLVPVLHPLGGHDAVSLDTTGKKICTPHNK